MKHQDLHKCSQVSAQDMAYFQRQFIKKKEKNLKTELLWGKIKIKNTNDQPQSDFPRLNGNDWEGSS